MRCCREVQIMKSGVLVQVWCRQLLGSWIQLSGANLFCWFPENFRRPYLLVIRFFKVQSKSHFSTLTSWLISGLLFPSAGQFLVSHPLSQIDTPKAGVIEIKLKKRFKKKSMKLYIQSLFSVDGKINWFSNFPTAVKWYISHWNWTCTHPWIQESISRYIANRNMCTCPSKVMQMKSHNGTLFFCLCIPPDLEIKKTLSICYLSVSRSKWLSWMQGRFIPWEW